MRRSSFRYQPERVRDSIAARVVLVTGAGGSIGSALCRHVASFQPAAIVAVDRSESALFELDAELRALAPGLPVHLELADIQDDLEIAEIFDRHRPAVVLHAAAYKHVSLMEAFPFHAVRNNVLGTFHVAEAAQRTAVASFILVSTDKAVLPVSIMGATKRIAERLIGELAPASTSFAAVRLGNVLGSSGSVLPIFERQIARGGPVTVTDPRMERLFTTIDEACRLTLQTLVTAPPGHICFAHPERIRIVDLARRAIELAGTGQEIKIEYTGVRPGEKLVEQIQSPTEPAHFDAETGLHCIPPQPVGSASPVASTIDELREICRTRDLPRLLAIFNELVPEYVSGEFVRRAAQV